MSFVRKIKGSLVKQDSSIYRGEDSYLFYDIVTGCIRISDGTPGGKPACIEGSLNVKEFPTFGDFPIIGESNVIYIEALTETMYRWDGNSYNVLGSASDDNVSEYSSIINFPVTGNTNIIYIDASTELIYRWNGSGYVEVGAAAVAHSGNNDFATLTIPGNTTGIVYTTAPGIDLTLKFIVSVQHTNDNEFASMEILASYNAFTGEVKYSKYAVIGDYIKYRPSVDVNAGIIRLNVQNNESNDIIVNMTRISTAGI